MVLSDTEAQTLFARLQAIDADANKVLQTLGL